MPTRKRRRSKDAIKYLSWYTQLMPKEYEALEHLGILLADRVQKGATDQIARHSAWRTIRWRRRCGWPRSDRPREGGWWRWRCWLRAGSTRDAKDHLERFLLVDSPKDADLLEQLADCQIGMQKFDQARETLKKAIANKPTQVTAYEKLAELLQISTGEPQGGRAVDDEAGESQRQVGESPLSAGGLPGRIPDCIAMTRRWTRSARQ